MSILKRFNFLSKKFWVDVLPAIELPDIFIAFLLAAILYVPFNLIKNSKTEDGVQDAFYRMNICLNVVSSKTTDKCVQGQYLDNSVEQTIKFVAYEKRNGEKEILSSYLLTESVRSEIEKLYSNAEKFHVLPMTSLERCPVEDGKPKQKGKVEKCEVFKNYKVIDSEVETYVVLYNKENVNKYAKELSLYLSSVF